MNNKSQLKSLNILLFLLLISVPVYIYAVDPIEEINKVSNSTYNVSNSTYFGIKQLESKWIPIDITGDFNVYMSNSSDKKTHISWYYKDNKTIKTINTINRYLYDCNGDRILDDKGKFISLKYETNKVPNSNELDGMSDGYFIRLTDASSVNIDSCITLNPTLIYQNQSMVQFIKDDLEINNTLKRWNGEEFVISPESLFIDNTNNKFKFGAIDTYPKQDTLYQYEWLSNKEIKYDKGYYFDEKLSIKTDISQFYERNYLDTSDICDNKCIESTGIEENYTCTKMFYPNCKFSLNNYYNNGNFTYSELKVNFTGYYNSKSDMIFIDPSYGYTNVSTSVTISTNVRSEPTYSHLAISDPNLILYMPFDINTSGTTYDYTNNDNDGTVTGAVWNTSGYYGANYYFNSSNDNNINLGDVQNVSELTISAWIKPYTYGEHANGLGRIISKHSTNVGWLLALNKDYSGLGNNNLLFFDGSTFHFTSDNSIELSKWQHVVVTMSTTTIKMYINGIINITHTGSYAVENNNINFYIGKDGGSTSLDYDGFIDEVTYWNRTLSSTEVLELYNGTYQRYYSQSNQTFMQQKVTLGSDDRANITIKGEALNDSSFNGRLYETDLSDYTGYVNTGTGLVGYWHFDNDSTLGENSSLVVDVSGNGNNGTINSSVLNNNGYYDGAILFSDTSTENIIIPYNPLFDLDSEFTLIVWINASSSGAADYQTILNKENGVSNRNFWLTLWTDGKLKLRISSSVSTTECDVSGTLNLKDDTWHQIVGLYNGTACKIYRDGNLINTDPMTSPPEIQSEPIWIGNQEVTPTRAFDGLIDEIMIFNRSLSADEIKELYLTGSIDYKNNGVGLNWTESSSGTQELTTLNSTYLRASDYVISSSSTNLLSEIEGNSIYRFYSGNLESITIDTFVGGAVTPTTFIINSMFPVNNTNTNDTTPSFQFNVTGTESSYDCDVELNGTIKGTNSSVNNATVTNITSSTLSNGLYTWLINCTSNGVTNQSETRYINITTVGDTCSYTSGNWEVDCADNCDITSNVDLGGNDLSVTGTGSFTVNANITNVGNRFFRGTDTSNICYVNIYNGGFK